MRKKSRTLTEQELEIMKLIWELESATVRRVYERMRERRQVAYTTVMTMMNILEDKGHLEKELEGRAYVYRPARPQGDVVSDMVEEFVERVFDGSVEPLVLRLVKDRRLSPAEIEEIRRMIDEVGGES